MFHWGKRLPLRKRHRQLRKAPCDKSDTPSLQHSQPAYEQPIPDSHVHVGWPSARDSCTGVSRACARTSHACVGVNRYCPRASQAFRPAKTAPRHVPIKPASVKILPWNLSIDPAHVRAKPERARTTASHVSASSLLQAACKLPVQERFGRWHFPRIFQHHPTGPGTMSAKHPTDSETFISL